MLMHAREGSYLLERWKVDWLGDCKLRWWGCAGCTSGSPATLHHPQTYCCSIKADQAIQLHATDNVIAKLASCSSTPHGQAQAATQERARAPLMAGMRRGTGAAAYLDASQGN